jgi:uncharacterized RDD family membrane protein YckC
MDWFYADGSERRGPVTAENLRALTASGVVTSDTLVWREGMADWRPLSEVGDRVGVASAPAGAASCAECGRTFPSGEMVAFRDSLICAECKPAFFQRLKEGGAAPGTLDYAGFWIRFVAKFVDGILLLAINLGMMFIAGRIFGVSMFGFDQPDPDEIGAFMMFQVFLTGAQLLVGGSYYIYFHGRFGASLGKMLVGLKVVRPDGADITYGRATGRYFGDILSGICCNIGYIMAGFDEEKRSLHDRICDTRVVRI